MTSTRNSTALTRNIGDDVDVAPDVVVVVVAPDVDVVVAPDVDVVVASALHDLTVALTAATQNVLNSFTTVALQNSRV